ncbi:MAG: PA0069 family radical SAM protein [Longimicrobiales bacterium]
MFGSDDTAPHALTTLTYRGRGAAHNPANRFEPIEVLPDGDALDALVAEGEDVAPQTMFLRDTTKTLIARNNSPDIGFDTSINVYRGCEHGCIYCYARPTHEYFGLSVGLDFETKIFVKQDAPELLRAELMKKAWQPQVIVMSGVTDPYQPAERRFRLTRRLLEVLLEFRNPVGIITKNHLVTRDLDLFSELAALQLVHVNLSVTSLRNDVQRVMEPRTATPARRLAAIEALAKAGVPVNVMVAPIVPGLTDEEVPDILRAVHDAGARSAGYVMLRLPFAVKELFERWLETHFPDRKDKVLNRVRGMRDGKLYAAEWGTRMRGEGIFADQIGAVFHATIRKLGMNTGRSPLRTDLFRRPAAGGQGDLFA